MKLRQLYRGVRSLLLAPLHLDFAPAAFASRSAAGPAHRSIAESKLHQFTFFDFSDLICTVLQTSSGLDTS